MHLPKVDGNKFCVPTTLSCITGLPTKTIARIISSQRRKGGPVKGSSAREIHSCLINLGYECTKYKPENDRVAYFISSEMKKNTKYIVVTENHAFAAYNESVYCTQFDGQPRHYSESKYRSTKIVSVFEITKEPKELPDLSNIIKKKSQSVDPFKRQFDYIVKTYNLTVEDYLKEDDMLWVYFPDNVEDPLDSHSFVSYEEAIQEIMSALRQ